MLSGLSLGLYCSLILNFFWIANATRGQEKFEEELVLHPLRDGRVASRFSFKTSLEGAIPRNPETLDAEDVSQHYTLFPLALGQVLREYAVSELHLSLNAGSWDYERWGYPDEAGVGTGAELWAWMGDGSPTTVDHRWEGLRNALSGLFCASLGSLDKQRTTSPTLGFFPEGSLPNWTHGHQLRHASLPSEHVCTENLTPFLKLLPCKALSGIASLLNPHRLFDADWHGMSIHVLWHEFTGIEVRLAFEAVFDPVRLSPSGKRDWSLQLLFDRTIHRSCPVASASRIVVDLPKGVAYAIAPDPPEKTNDQVIYDVNKITSELDISLRWPLESKFEYPLTDPETPLTQLSVQRTLKGTSQSHGQLLVSIRNNLAVDVEAVYLETMPWLLQFYLHTLRITVDGRERNDLISDISYTPPVPHSRPMLFEAVLRLPANATIYMTIEATKSFLRYTEHPPDAQRGWDLPPAVFMPISLPTESKGEEESKNETGTTNPSTKRYYTRILLVDPATPDFSMPYNVIIMSCTLIALTFGSVFNLLTRKFILVRVADGDKEEHEETTEKIG